MAQIFRKLFGLFENHEFKKNVVVTFLATFMEIGLLLIPPSGHTAVIPLIDATKIDLQELAKNFDFYFR